MKTAVWACTSISTCAASFFAYAIPALQVLALSISIIAGIRAFVVSRRKKDQP